MASFCKNSKTVCDQYKSVNAIAAPWRQDAPYNHFLQEDVGQRGELF